MPDDIEPAREPPTVTAQQRAAEREIHAGAQEAGIKIAGLTEVDNFETSLAGSKDAPVEIGEKITVQVRVAEDGTLLPRRENSDESTPPATSILTIEVIPSIEFDSSGDPQVIWTGYARQTDVETGRVITSSRSGPSREVEEQLQGDRPSHEYGNDPAFIDGMLEHAARSRSEAATRALDPLVSGGKMNVGRAEPTPVGPAPSRRRRVIAATAATAVLTAGAVGFVATRDADPDAAPAPTTVTRAPVTPEPTIVDAEPTNSGTPAPPETPPPPDPVDEGTAAPGTYEISGRVSSACGGDYEVFLRMILFLNGQVTIDQLLTAGGNSFQSATGRWNSELAVARSARPDLFEVWLVVMVSEALAIYNIYGPTAAAVSADSEPDPAAYADVRSADDLAAAVGADPTSCATEVTDITTEYSEFPG